MSMDVYIKKHDSWQTTDVNVMDLYWLIVSTVMQHIINICIYVNIHTYTNILSIKTHDDICHISY